MDSTQPASENLPPIQWKVDLFSDGGNTDKEPAFLYDVKLLAIVNDVLGVLWGEVVVYDGDPPFVEYILRNDFFLPTRDAQRLIRLIFECWRYELDWPGGLESEINLREWLRRVYADEGDAVWAMLTATIRTFAFE
jgi:hypothetical protein